jgi:glycosyl transferase family 25
MKFRCYRKWNKAVADSRARPRHPVKVEDKALLLSSRYDRIRIVNLKSRPDRRWQMECELARVGFSPGAKIAFFDGMSFTEPGPFKRIGSHGAYRTHLAILREAAEAGESVLILQDDCSFLPAIHNYELPDEVDIFYGGYDASDPADLHNSEIVGAHFMGFSNEAARKAVAYLEALLDPEYPPDAIAAAVSGFDPAIRPPIDGSLVWFRRAHPELKTVFAMLSKQRPSRTDIGDQQVLDRVWGLRDLANLARTIKHKLGFWMGRHN